MLTFILLYYRLLYYLQINLFTCYVFVSFSRELLCTLNNSYFIIISPSCINIDFIRTKFHFVWILKKQINCLNKLNLKTYLLKKLLFFSSVYETEEIGLCGDPICVSTLSSHCRGPCKWISIQHGVDVTSWRWYSAPHPFTKDILKK